MSSSKKNKSPGDNSQPSSQPTNIDNGTAWLSCPGALFAPNRSASANSSNSKSKDTSSHQAKKYPNENGFTNENVNERKTDKTKKHDNTQYLALIEKIVKKFQDENEAFADLMKNILDATDTKDMTNKSIKYDLINAILLNLSESNIEEISFIKDKVKAILIPEHMKHLYVADSAIEILIPLGAGSSGEVFLGSIVKNNKRKAVAVKRAKNALFNDMIENEACIMSKLDHENIVKLLAINRDMPEIVVELMEFGNFGEAIEKINFSNENIVKILKDVASGMEYLHKHDFLHRDLAIRNIFIDAKKRCKIGDFGTCVFVGNTQGVYKDKILYAVGYNISPETLLSQLFTKESDVWAMGTLILEVFFSTVEELRMMFPMRIAMLNAFRSGFSILERPSSCPDSIFTYCEDHLLNSDPRSRPNFTFTKNKMQEILERKMY